MKSLLTIVCAAIIFFSACSSIPEQPSFPSVKGDAPCDCAPGPVPVADHHAHLVSPAAAWLQREVPQPRVDLPEELEKLLEQFSQHWDDATLLGALLTDDALLLDPFEASWIRGRDEVALYLGELFARQYRITPVKYELHGGVGHLAGYYSREEAGNEKHIGHVLMSLSREPEAGWKVAAQAPRFPGPFTMDPITAADLVANLDEAGVQRAAVLSVAYWFGSAHRQPMENEYERVRAENDWTLQQVSQYPDRLTAICSFNPLKEYAGAELERCADVLRVKAIKLHFGNSGVDVRRAEDLEKLRAVFRAANDRGLAIVVHLWTDPSYETEGAEHAGVFLDELLPAAPDVMVQIAHMAGGGRSTDTALSVFADAIAEGDPRTKNLLFDLATLTGGQSDENLVRDAERIRQIGLDRIVYGTDTSPPHPAPREAWNLLRTRLPLTSEEFRRIAGNVAPYLR
jgi:predicted TIM-barrel fold metal-dependent hydrolase